MMAQSQQRTSGRGEPSEPTRLRRDASGRISRAPSPMRHRRDASGRIYRASSSITSVESMRLACAPPSTNAIVQRRQPVKYHSQVPASSSVSSESSSSMPTNSRLPSGGSFWTKGKSLFSKYGKKKDCTTKKGDSSTKHTTNIGNHAVTAASIDYNLNSTETQVREDGDEYYGEYIDERYTEKYEESVCEMEYEESVWEMESLESVCEMESLDTAERRAVIKDSWDFFRMVCSLLRDRRKYDEVFRRMQFDPVYPYLDTMMGMNDSVDDVPRKNAGENKLLSQVARDEYYMMPASAIARDLVQQAVLALPSLEEVCKALTASLGIDEYAMGPVKDAGSALRKAEEKYEGDVLKVTDFCRALIVVEDFPTLLALFELACDSFSPLIRRVKISTLQTYRASKPGGYRDCIINLELKDHICEISVHLQPMWAVCGVDGFRHYRHCLKYSIDTFGDPMDALAGLDRMTVSELIGTAEKEVYGMPLETLEWHQEKFILNYFCKALLFLHHGLNELAETSFTRLINLRCQHPDIGPDHPETIALFGYLKQSLQAQRKNAEAEVVAEWILESDQKRTQEKAEDEKPIWDQFILEPLETIVDPSKKEREAEEKIRKEMRASKNAWKEIRGKRFKFLDGI
ncbi:hypothetical protein ACHAW5_006664 [Stephanodiscus triporus]|uniref:Uncharacterized protein n=1 Tax=Stephanodiscus triporus TaxID=2934178 RepID=A0ABD3MLL3_9STRA